MLKSKTIDRVAAAGITLAAAFCLLAMVFSDVIAEAFGGAGVSMEYETELFDTSKIIEIDIAMDEDDWAEMLENAINEEYYECDVTINGTTFYRVGIRPKGNTSLTSIASDPDTDRYSFKLEFDQYVDGQTCWGLDKLVLNNNYADATNMKEALTYDMFQFLGADASLYNYAEISVNGEYWGVYLALEAVEDSFMLRNYGVSDGELYKPEGMDGGGGGFSMGGGGADLNYTDDDLDSYSTIWEGEVTNTTDADHERVVAALQKAGEGEELETYLDVDNLLRYMAVHSFVVNEDSLSGNMPHNYYLYEYDGQLNIIPWDYNLTLGGMGMGDASSVINDPIDTPFSGTDFFDALLDNEEYLEQYHAYYRQLVEEYVDGGRMEETYNRIRSQIDSLVETDPTAFYSYEEYEAAAEILYETVLLRAESVRGQLDGTIPSTEEGQRADSSALLDASSIDLSVMGSMMGGGGGGRGGQMEERQPGNEPGAAPAENGKAEEETDSAGEDALPTAFTAESVSTMPLSAAASEPAESAPSDADGEQTPPDNAGTTPEDAGTAPEDAAPPDSGQSESGGSGSDAANGEDAGTGDEDAAPQMPEDFDPSEFDFSEMTPPEDAGNGEGMNGSRGGGPGGGMEFGGEAETGSSAVLQNAVWYGGCLLLLVIALLIAGVYRRRPKIRHRRNRQKALPPGT